MAYNALDVVKDFMNGSIEYVAQHVRDERAKVCMECEHIMKVPMTRIGTCKQCGCFMDAKTTLARASCPLNKWQK